MLLILPPLERSNKTSYSVMPTACCNHQRQHRGASSTWLKGKPPGFARFCAAQACSFRLQKPPAAGERRFLHSLLGLFDLGWLGRGFGIIHRDPRFRTVELTVGSHFEHRRQLRVVRSNGGRNCIALLQQTNTAKL